MITGISLVQKIGTLENFSISSLSTFNSPGPNSIGKSTRFGVFPPSQFTIPRLSFPPFCFFAFWMKPRLEDERRTSCVNFCPFLLLHRSCFSFILTWEGDAQPRLWRTHRLHVFLSICLPRHNKIHQFPPLAHRSSTVFLSSVSLPLFPSPQGHRFSLHQFTQAPNDTANGSRLELDGACGPPEGSVVPGQLLRLQPMLI